LPSLSEASLAARHSGVVGLAVFASPTAKSTAAGQSTTREIVPSRCSSPQEARGFEVLAVVEGEPRLPKPAHISRGPLRFVKDELASIVLGGPGSLGHWAGTFALATACDPGPRGSRPRPRGPHGARPAVASRPRSDCDVTADAISDALSRYIDPWERDVPDLPGCVGYVSSPRGARGQ
jgi:hypothetical protein